MAKPTDTHPERGRTRMVASYADQDFEEATELDEAGRPTDEEIESNELHAGTGEQCSKCKRVIAPGSQVRRTTRGDYVHEMCPPH